MNEFWDKRFATEEYIYGKEANEFFAEQLKALKPGKIIFLGEGEGRNAVHAAKNGWTVKCVDFSTEARKKALKFAAEEKVELDYQISNVVEFEADENSYDAVVMIFLHLEAKIRVKVHQKVAKILKPGGVVMLEAFEKEQINKNSGGPKNLEMLYSLEDIFEDFQDLDVIKFSKSFIMLNESIHHKGEAVVVRYLGQKV